MGKLRKRTGPGDRTDQWPGAERRMGEAADGSVCAAAHAGSRRLEHATERPIFSAWAVGFRALWVLDRLWVAGLESGVGKRDGIFLGADTGGAQDDGDNGAKPN